MLTPATSPGRMLQNMRSALSRGLPEVVGCRPHGHILSIAGGGPSLADTKDQLTGVIAAVNGSLGFLLERGIVPNVCGILDPGAHMPDVITADRRVRYYVASICDPAVFDKLKDCEVRLFHSSSVCGALGLLELRGGPWIAQAGRVTMGLQWGPLGYVLGFRTLHFHGLDSSFRDGATHAYADANPNRRNRPIQVEGRWTAINFLEQVDDFFTMLESFRGLDPVTIEMFGDGLLQDRWKAYQRKAAA